MDLYDKVEPLAKKDLLLLGAFIESVNRRTLRDIHLRFTKKLQKEFNEYAGEDITRHRLHYLELIGLLKSNKFGRSKEKGAEIFFNSDFEDKEWCEVMLRFGIYIKKDEERPNEVGHEVVEKLQGLLEVEKEEKPKGRCGYLIDKVELSPL